MLLVLRRTASFAPRLRRSPYATMAGPGADWTHVAAASDRPAYYVFDKHIERSQQDDRHYRLIQLENGLRAILVSDPKGDKSAASLDVGVGHLYDPVSTRSISGQRELISARMICLAQPISASTCSSW
jgi:hypothetical protein